MQIIYLIYSDVILLMHF